MSVNVSARVISLFFCLIEDLFSEIALYRLILLSVLDIRTSIQSLTLSDIFLIRSESDSLAVEIESAEEERSEAALSRLDDVDPLYVVFPDAILACPTEIPPLTIAVPLALANPRLFTNPRSSKDSV